MKVLLFALGNDFPKSPFLPHFYSKRCVAYTGTHDNNTIQGMRETGTENKEVAIIGSLGNHFNLNPHIEEG